MVHEARELLRELAMIDKFGRVKFHKIQGKDITFNEFIEYMVGKEVGREDFAGSTSESEIEDEDIRDKDMC
jgi:hypothetical protein